jgi:8-oxo-dGTP pyrophosphatase MutT (NUDIX family)
VTRPDHHGDGDGWVECAAGHRHWGRYGAAGLLAHRRTGSGSREVLLQHRAEWSHFGGTWGILGGARASHETAVEAALREAGEEGAVDAREVHADGRYDDDHGGWSYVTVIATASERLIAQPSGGESIDVVWHDVERVADLALHPGFATSWPVLRAALSRLTIVVDAANVMGSRPDGWWRDRAGAARRIIDDAAAVARDGLPDDALPDELDRAPLRHWWPQLVIVVEGAARPAADAPPADVTVVAAKSSGDDEIVAQVERLRDRGDAPIQVVTADRELRARCTRAGAVVVGPQWWLRLRSAN